MRTFVTCMQCLSEFGVPRFSTSDFVMVNDDGLISMTCDLGHETASIIQNEKFEILAEMAVEAIVREHYREAVGSFASALERLQEYFVKVVCRNRGVDAEIFSQARKPMANLSERQIGAFMVAYLLEAGKPAVLLPQRAVELRNKVVHNGQIASRTDAICFGQAVADCAFPILQLIGEERFSRIVLELTSELIRDRGRAVRSRGLRSSTAALASIFQINGSVDCISIEKAVENFSARPNFEQAVEQSRALGALIDPSHD